MSTNKCTEKLVQCPYDKLHKVREDRLQFHLIKCKRQNQDKDFVICPFNTTHHMPKDEYDKHAEICPDKKLMLRNSKAASDSDEGCQFKPEEENSQKDAKEKVMSYLIKSRQKKVLKIKEKEAAENTIETEYDREYIGDLGPMGVMQDPSIPPDAKYSAGRGYFLPKSGSLLIMEAPGRLRFPQMLKEELEKNASDGQFEEFTSTKSQSEESSFTESELSSASTSDL